MKNDGLIILIVNREIDNKTGWIKHVVSHGVDYATNHEVVMPPVHPSEVGGVFDYDIGEWVIRG